MDTDTLDRGSTGPETELLLPEDMAPMPLPREDFQLPRMRTRVWWNPDKERWNWAIWQPRPDLTKPEEPLMIRKYGCGGYTSEEAAVRGLEYQREVLVASGEGYWTQGHTDYVGYVRQGSDKPAGYVRYPKATDPEKRADELPSTENFPKKLGRQ